MSSVVQNLKLEQISTNGGTQPRTSLNEAAVVEYSEALTDGAKLPPVTVFHDGSAYWLADGFHRFFAHKKIGALDIAVEIKQGTQRDAILHSVGANAAHGLRRTNDDKRKAVATLLEDAEWSSWSDREIARQCGVSHEFVRQLRSFICQRLTDGNREAIRTVERAGKTYEQNTANIGKKKDNQAVPPVAQPANEPEVPLEPERDGPSDEELAAMESAEAADREILAKMLDSDDALAIAHAEIKRLNALAAGLEQRVNGLLNEKAEAIRLLKKEKNRADRLQKQIDAVGRAA